MTKTNGEHSLKYANDKAPIVVMVVVAIVLFLALFLWSSEYKWLKGLAALIFTIGPPIWFFVEYTCFSTEIQKSDKDYRERLKFSQDIAARIWLAIAGIFVANYFDSIASLIK